MKLTPLGAPSYPVSLVLAHRRCLVVGGGHVARRKIDGLLAAGALVTVVAPEIGPDILALPVQAEQRAYRQGETAGYWLVVTATGVPEVDRAVFADGDACGVLVNSADDIPGCSFVLPAVVRRGAVSVAVSTDGTSPALAGWLRDRIATVIGPDIAELAELVGAARTAIRAAGLSSEGRPWRELLDGALPGLVAAGRTEDAWREVERWTAAQLESHSAPRDRRAGRSALPEARIPKD